MAHVTGRTHAMAGTNLLTITAGSQFWSYKVRCWESWGSKRPWKDLSFARNKYYIHAMPLNTLHPHYKGLFSSPFIPIMMSLRPETQFDGVEIRNENHECECNTMPHKLSFPICGQLELITQFPGLMFGPSVTLTFFHTQLIFFYWELSRSELVLEMVGRRKRRPWILK